MRRSKRKSTPTRSSEECVGKTSVTKEKRAKINTGSCINSNASDKQSNKHACTNTDWRDIKAKHVATISVKSVLSTSKCRITGSVLLPNNKLVIVDINNKEVKVIDTVKNKLISQIKVDDSPWCVCQASATSVAVTLYSRHTIVFIEVSVTGKLLIKSEVGLASECMGIAIVNEKMYVSSRSPPKVTVMTMEGTVLDTLETDLEIQRIFDYPQYVTVDCDKECMYVSNLVRDEIVRLSLDGVMQGVYKDSELQRPEQVAMDPRGFLYVAGHCSHNVHMISPDCTKIKVLLDEKDGLIGVNSLSFCANTNRLYIGMVGNKIKVFKLLY